MPIYEYQCNNCDHKLEVIQRISDDPLKDCPECGDDSLRKLISTVSFRLKGTGWYETDFKDKTKSKGNGKSAADSGSKKGSFSKSDSKDSSTSSATDSKTASSSS